MSDDLDYTDDDLNDDDTDAQAPAADPNKGWRKRLETKARTATERADAAERKLAFIEAGVNPAQDKRLAYFMDGYKGELTPEAIKAEATAAGFLQADEDAEDVIPAEERAAHERIAATATGARSTGSFDFDTAIAEAKAAGQMHRVIELKQAQSHAARAQ